jgi:hypothetical protein
VYVGLKTYSEAAGPNDAVVNQIIADANQIYSQTRWLLSETEGSISDSDSDSEQDTKGSYDGLKLLVKDIKTHLDCLLDISTSLESPAFDTEGVDEPNTLKIEQRSPHDYHSDLILAKFPKVHVNLALCLGITSWNRYQRMQEERERSANGSTSQPTQEQLVDPDAKSGLGISEFQDSGIGTSLPSAPPTRYAETAISFMTGKAGGKRVQIPPLPAEAKTGALFECNACGKHIRARNNREWR